MADPPTTTNSTPRSIQSALHKDASLRLFNVASRSLEMSASALVMPGVFPVVGRTEKEAQEIFAELNANIDASPQAMTVLSERLGSDMSVYPLDQPVPELPETEHLKSRAALLLQMARRERLTLRQLFHRVAAARGRL